MAIIKRSTNCKSRREESCRKKISTLLSYLGFHDDDPQTTLQLREIKDSHKKLSHIRKFVFKRLQQHTRITVTLQPPHDSEPTIAVAATAADDNVNDDNNNTEVELMEFVRQISGSEVKLVIEKELQNSDISSNQGRLLIPVMRVKNPDFLTNDEKKKVKKSEISVWMFDLERRKSTLNLIQWSMKSSKNYVLKTGWNKVVATNGLQKEMVIRVFSFRVDNQLCFALQFIGWKPN